MDAVAGSAVNGFFSKMCEDVWVFVVMLMRSLSPLDLESGRSI